MNIINLVINSINRGMNPCYKARHALNNKIEVEFKLSVPKWFDDYEWIKNGKNHIVMYSNSKKLTVSTFKVNIHNYYLGYPAVSNNKFLCYEREYDVKDWVTEPNFNFDVFLTREREMIFREIKSVITLEKIGELSKQYQTELNGEYHHPNDFNFAKTKFNAEVDFKHNFSLRQEFYNETKNFGKIYPNLPSSTDTTVEDNNTIENLQF